MNTHRTVEPLGERVVSSSAAMRYVMQEIARAAERSVHVFLCGERGTGRETLARAIHTTGRHNEGPFVAVDCAKFSAQELEAHLFATNGNHGSTERRSVERVRRTAQLFQSKGGTLFLQNIVDLPARLQTRLLRVLRDGEVVIMDEATRVVLDHRVITAGDATFDVAVKDGRMLPDLYKRLCGMRVDVPALRQRREDIPELAAHLLHLLCARENIPAKQLSNASNSLLAALPWRGNSEELRRLLEVLIMRASTPTISLDDVLANVRLDGQATWFAVGGSLREARARFETEYIAAVVAHHHGRIPEAAKSLGIQRSNLYRKMRRLNVRPKVPA
jgi:two-component system, NtrC family, nitrogen regulation response regulator NtrX